MTIHRITLTAALAMALASAVHAQIKGPSTGSTPYVLPILPGMETISVFTTDNTLSNADDAVNGYGMAGIPDGTGAFDNGDGTFTLLANHELGDTVGVTRAHGGKGAFVSRWIIKKNTLEVLAGEDLFKHVFGWNASTQDSNTAEGTFAFNRYCSADLPEVTAFYNAATGLGTQERIFMDGEESGSNGWARGHVVTGPDAGKSYILGKFNLSTNGSGRTGVGGWENLLASPFPQDKTIVIGTNDGGSGIMNNALAVYAGTKNITGLTEVSRAGLTNGTLKFVVVAGNTAEIPSANGTSRVTNIANGTRFSLSGTSSTTFSRPEDGAWNPLNPREFYFVTTDQIDQVSDGLGAQIGKTRLWRLTFDNITDPDAGGKIDVLIDGQTVGGQKVNMFDNITVNRLTGHLLIQEDVGGSAHNGKIWEYDPSTFTGTTNSGILTMIAKHDPAKFGDRVAGVTTAATSPYNNDEESSGVMDITNIMSTSTLHRGNLGEAWYISSDQAHYTSGITTAQVEGGQFFIIHQLGVTTPRTGFVRDRRTGTYAQEVTVTNNTISPVSGPIYVWLDNLSANATLVNKSGTTGNYIVVPGTNAGLAPGASASVVLQFANPSAAGITYTARVVGGTP